MVWRVEFDPQQKQRILKYFEEKTFRPNVQDGYFKLDDIAELQLP